MFTFDFFAIFNELDHLEGLGILAACQRDLFEHFQQAFFKLKDLLLQFILLIFNVERELTRADFNSVFCEFEGRLEEISDSVDDSHTTYGLFIILKQSMSNIA